MPKMKTHKGAAKRFKRTGSGKIKFQKAWHGHNRNKKSATRWRRADGTGILSGGDAKRIDRMLGN
ncbi:MAG: 50S ribosomal protein L35 [Acidimicrobiia bacterium]